MIEFYILYNENILRVFNFVVGNTTFTSVLYYLFSLCPLSNEGSTSCDKEPRIFPSLIRVPFS